MITKSNAIQILTRLLKGGKIVQLPRKRTQLNVLLLLLAASFEEGVSLSEKEVNVHIKNWLFGWTRPESVDHVTVRRYLVDYQFLKRDHSGLQYATASKILRSSIEGDARDLHPREIMRSIQEEREKRKLRYALIQ